ncbi:maleamate amidohydrolase [Pseudomonas taetrolens]|uniref:Isochorismatase n=1 Tax=Pseudomonas taetrolens TaxID=47884 RepID=A0A0J6GMP2_PSETA|nr:N-carbamoylsarcosine amidohydrolase [Pseudomonas taetrolens]KMM82860.1 isochorismatase [Pseudomonas taetrolens]SEC08217.1 maleamate amidohydrolase [Pseudomonas taetrolens]SQF85918.1 putative isochorismatase [Pseudomonas taetrolens]VEH48995.1 putative isochorismatase [Pseudomonas taetrolens]
MNQEQSADANYAGVWGQRIGFGNKPALLMIDFMKGYTQEGAPLFAPGVVSAVAQSVELLACARQANILVVHTNIRYHPGHFADGGIWIKKAPVMRDMVEGNPLADFCEPLQPNADEVVISKQYASSFFGTSLASLLRAQGIDTVVLAGCSTSGCIRATAVDAVQHGFRTIVVRECVGDRHSAPHEANLFDIDSKYGDVVSKQEAMNHFSQ